MKHKFTFLASLLAAIGLLGVNSPAEAGITVNLTQIQSTVTNVGSPHNYYADELNDLFGTASVWAGTVEVKGAGTVKFFYHGQESGYFNSFEVSKDDGASWAPLYTENGPHNPADAWTEVQVGEIELDVNETLLLRFTTGGNGIYAPGADTNSASVKGFGIFGRSGLGNDLANFLVDDRLYFGLDDSGGNKPNNDPDDDNHDDMIISMEFTSTGDSDGTVPEPATLAIWGLGLGIAGLVKLRRRQTAA